MKKVTEEIGDKTPNEDLQRLIKNGASNDTDIPYEEFHSIMTKENRTLIGNKTWKIFRTKKYRGWIALILK